GPARPAFYRRRDRRPQLLSCCRREPDAALDIARLGLALPFARPMIGRRPVGLTRAPVVMPASAKRAAADQYLRPADTGPAAAGARADGQASRRPPRIAPG